MKTAQRFAVITAATVGAMVGMAWAQPTTPSKPSVPSRPSLPSQPGVPAKPSLPSKPTLPGAPSLKGDILTTAATHGDFTMFVKLVTAAGLMKELQAKGPFTVFAPTDEAFAKLPAGTVDDWLKPENKERLRGVLNYHVVAGSFTADKLGQRKFADTLNGQRLDITGADGSVTVDQSKVTKADIHCSNGVIHGIDTVAMPVATDVLTTAAAGVGGATFKTFGKAVEAAGISSQLAGEGPFTIFAPTDEAFAKLAPGTLDNLMKPENRARLAALLTYHIVPGRLYSDQAIRAGKAKTIQGYDVRITGTGGQAMVNNAKITKADFDASNGVIHVIDTVLTPPTNETTTEPKAPPKSSKP